MSKPVISCSKNGPLIVKGLENFIDSDGSHLETKPAMGLCRCGASLNKPFCDGNHSLMLNVKPQSPLKRMACYA